MLNKGGAKQSPCRCSLCSWYTVEHRHNQKQVLSSSRMKKGTERERERWGEWVLYLLDAGEVRDATV